MTVDLQIRRHAQSFDEIITNKEMTMTIRELKERIMKIGTEETPRQMIVYFEEELTSTMYFGWERYKVQVPPRSST